MAFRHGDAFTQAGVHNIGYYIQKIMSGAYTLHASTIQTTGNNDTRYARTSQEASDNARLIFDILMDPDVASYELFNGVVDKFWGGSFAASYYYHFGQGGTPAPDIPTDPTLYGRCQAFIDNPLDVNCQAGNKQPGLYPASGNGSYYTAICGLLGYIEVVSGYNPAHNLNHYAGIFNGIGLYPDTATLTPPAIYTDNGFPRYPGVAQRPIDITPNYDFPVQYDNGVSFTRPWIVRWNENYRQELMEYGILGLTCPVSVNGYSYQIPVCYNSQKTITQGYYINLLEQIWFDILGLPRGNGNSNGSIAEGRNSDHLRMRGLGIPYYSNGYSYFPFTAQGGSIYYNVTGSATSASSPSVFENNWQYWNGNYTKRPFTRNMAEYGLFEKWGAENMLPPFSTPADYENYPWCCMVQDGQPEQAALDCIHSIQTWRESSYWTAAKIQQAQEAARYWYNYFYSEHQGGGSPIGPVTPAGRQKEWRWVIYR